MMERRSCPRNCTLVDHFTAPSRDPKKWNNHILGRIGRVQPYDPNVPLSQGNGELQIAPLNAVSDYHCNGYLASDEMRWETSPDSATWTQVFSWPREWDMSAVYAELMAGSWRASSNPGIARFGPFSLK